MQLASNDRRHYCNAILFICPLFQELNKTTKLNGVNIDTIPTLTGITCVFEFAKIKGAKIIIHVKSPTFRAA